MFIYKLNYFEYGIYNLHLIMNKSFENKNDKIDKNTNIFDDLNTWDLKD